MARNATSQMLSDQPLEHIRNDFVGDHLTIAFPECSILLLTFDIISKCTMDQQDRHEHEVELRQQVAKPTGQAVGQGIHQITNIVKMP